MLRLISFISESTGISYSILLSSSVRFLLELSYSGRIHVVRTKCQTVDRGTGLSKC